MAIGKCLKCDEITTMTEDHVFPKWLRKALPNFGIKVPPTQEVHLICSKCNAKKGANLDYSDEMTRTIMKEIVHQFTSRIREHEEFHP